MDQVKLFFSNLSDSIGLGPSVLGNILGAIALLVVGYLIAKILSGVVRKLINKSGIQERVDKGAKGKGVNIGKLIGKLVYYLLMVVVLMAVLDMLGVTAALKPLENLVTNFVSFLPQIIGAGAIAFAGYIIATLVSELVSLAVAGIEGLTERFGLSDNVNWAKLAGQVIFFLIFIPILIAAIDTLGIEAIAGPATSILQDVLSAIPKVLAAGVILAVFFYLGKFVSGFVSSLLEGVNVDGFAEKMQLTSLIGNTSIAKVVSGVVFFFIMFSGILTAVDILEFTKLASLFNEMFEITVQILFGLAILAIGNVIATYAANAISSSQGSSFLASIARFAILGLFIAIALRTMGLADDIVNLAFGLTLGSLAVAFALSFGLGGREAAGKQMEAFLSKFRNEASK
ncbi:MAG: mechanosensitive ion channel [Saprospiraceae bacterium]